MPSYSHNKVPPFATPDILHDDKKPQKSKRRDPVPLPGGVALFKPSWRALLLNIMEVAKLACMPVAAAVISLLAFFVAFQHRHTGTEALFNGLGAVGMVIALGLGLAIMPAFGLVQLKSARGELADFRDEFITGLPLFWRYFAINIIVALSTIVGLFLFIVPGLLVLHRFMLAPYYVLDRELGVRTALRASAADARRYRTALWQLVTVSVIIRGLVFAPVLGWFIAPILQIAYAYAPAVRYVEVFEAKRETTYAKRHTLLRTPRRHAKKS